MNKTQYRYLDINSIRKGLSNNRYLSDTEIKEITNYTPLLHPELDAFLFKTDYPSDICEICRERLIEKRANLTINDIDGCYKGTFVQSVHFCPICKRYYITLADKDMITNEIYKMKSKLIRFDSEKASDSEYVLHNKDYLDLPVLETELIIDFEDNYRRYFINSGEDEAFLFTTINGLNDESVLGKMGYRSNLPVKERHFLLDQAINQYGKRRIIDLLQFHINMRKARSEHFKKSINIWKEDIEYIIRH